MAIMVPALPNEETQESERKVYFKLRDTLSDDYTVFHSLPYLTKETQKNIVEGEVDFVILHPEKGMLILEIKGGREIQFDPKTSKWFSLSRNNEIHPIKDPFKQASKNLHSLKDKILLALNYPSKSTLPFTHGYAVVFPDAVLGPTEYPPHIIKEVIIDGRTVNSIGSSIERIIGYWERGDTAGKISKEIYQLIIEKVFFPEFHLCNAFPVQMDDEKQTLIRLTKRQYETLNKNMKKNRRALIEGYAGTGKTTIALLKARELAQQEKKVLYLCYNEQLSDYLQNQLKDCGNITVNHYHAFARQVILQNSNYIWPKAPAAKFWDEVVPTQLMDVVDSKEITFDAVIVDEAQDFKNNWWTAIELMAPKKSAFYIFYDPRQNIYNTELSIPELPAVFPLTENCRTTQKINDTIRQYGAEELIESGMNPPGIEVIKATCASELDMRKKLGEMVRKLKQEYQVKSNSIILLSPLSFEKSIFGKSDRLEGYIINEYQQVKLKENELHYETIYSFKGLEADAVIVFGIRKQSADYNDLCYVATSRARHILCFIEQSY